ncbi:MAG: CvpA family protein [Candidatus Omnitrophica bacterium]|nr:CvpA family protein [Candidatus Omnitrophota bacterium]
METIKSFKFIDLLSLFVILRILYIAVKKGLICEFTKLFGVLFACFFSLQYYSQFLRKFSSESLKQSYLDFFSFFTIFVFVSFCFFFIRKLVTALSKDREQIYLEKWVSLFLGAVRASFLISAVIFASYLLSSKNSLFAESVSFRIFKNVAAKSYLLSFNLYAKLNPGAQSNKEVVEYHEVEKNLSGSNKKSDRK